MKIFCLDSPIFSFSVLLVLRYNVKATPFSREPFITECGNNICGIFEYCCNESCGTCASFFGGSCTEEYCCPEALPNNGCSREYVPVKCSDECVYANACQADAAGQVGCCPTPGDDVVCPDVYAPVTCANGCEYDNDCLAEAAGQDINTCNAMCGPNTCEIGEVCCNESCGICAPPGGACTEEYCCPTPSEDIFCDYTYAPVVCADGCEYDNKCFAEAAGHEVGTCGGVNCPTPSENVVCPYLYAPITCLDGCAYDNDCLAEAAGQDINTCNAIVGPECGPNTCEIGEVCCNESCGICAPPGGFCTEEYCCPTPSEDIFCDYRYAPVVCADGCEYDNKCFAEAAGHEVGTCGGVNCPTPSENVVCPYLYAPITCLDGCVYDNDCLAEAAGQDINTCNAIVGPECGPNTCEIGEVCCNESCGICAPPGGFCTEEYCCPTPSEDIFCDYRYAPVVCADGCEYDNKCFAEAAGHEVGTCWGI